MLTTWKMAKRMQYSVVGLPHYTIWHLYEPSVDDIRHMEEMEVERVAREAADKEKNEQEQKLKDTFEIPKHQWEQDRTDIEKYKEAAAQKEAEVEASGGADE